MRHLATLLIALALLSAGRALSQTEPPSPSEGLRDFCAQRPGKATPPCILDAGHLQIETGLIDPVFQHGGGVHDDTYALGATDLRLGVSRRVELEPPGAGHPTRRGSARSGRGRRQPRGPAALRS